MTKLNLDNLKGDVKITLKESDLRKFGESIAREAIALYKTEISRHPDDVYYTIKEVCSIFSIDRTTMYRWSKQKYLTPIKMGGLLRYRKSDIQNIINAAQDE